MREMYKRLQSVQKTIVAQARRLSTRTAVRVGILAAVAGAGAVLLLYQFRFEEQAVLENTSEPVYARRAIDGAWVLPGQEFPPLAGVMIENMIEAQPISGVAEAALVFEALAEADITRFLVYFVLEDTPSESPPPRGGEKIVSSPAGGEARRGGSEIGPVRSARPYYLDWAAEFDTLYAHAGSSPAAYEMLRKRGVEGVHDLDQWYNDEYYFQKNGRPRPHHFYTSSELLRKAYADAFRHSDPELVEGEESRANARPTSVGDPFDRLRAGSSSSPQDDNDKRIFGAWQFKNDAPLDLRGQVREITVEYRAPYTVRWAYDGLANQYTRLQWNEDGEAHQTADGKTITAKNIAVAFQVMEILDAIGRKKFTTIGEGRALVFQDGRVVEGTWEKPSVRERMRFYDLQGDEIEFNAGVTWVQIVPVGYAVKY